MQTQTVGFMPDVTVSYEKIAAVGASMLAAFLSGVKVWKVIARQWEARRKALAHRTHMLESISHRVEEMSARQLQIELTTHLIHAATGMTLVLAGIPAWRSDPDGKCLFVTPLLAEIMDMSETSARGWGWLSAVHPEDRETVRSEYVKACAERRIFAAHYRYKHHNGHVIYVASASYPVINPSNGEIIEYWGRAVEVTREEWEQQR